MASFRLKKSAKQFIALTLSKDDDRVIYARKADETGDSSKILEGEEIDLKTASQLKELVWGSSNMPVKTEWVKQGLIFHPAEQVFAYALQCPQNGTKNFIMCFQAYLLKQLLFDKKSKGGTARPANARNRPSGRQQKTGESELSHTLKPTEKTQQEIFAGAVTELLFKLAEGGEAVFCLPGSDGCFEPTAHYAIDGITEKLRLFKTTKEEEMKSFIKRHTAVLQEKNGAGLVCLLYSILLSRNPDRVVSDLQDQSNLALIDPQGDGTAPLLHLLIIGKATPYLHNGILAVEEADSEVAERVGITARNEIGLLLFEKDDAATANLNLGSRLKTPVIPVWVTRCNGKVGVLFNPNRELMRSYHAENRFQLYYYSDPDSKKGETIRKETVLTIDTRNLKATNGEETEFDGAQAHPLEKAIQTKWEGCEIEWNGATPFV